MIRPLTRERLGSGWRAWLAAAAAAVRFKALEDRVRMSAARARRAGHRGLSRQLKSSLFKDPAWDLGVRGM